VRFNRTELIEDANGGIVLLEFEVDDTTLVKIDPPGMELNPTNPGTEPNDSFNFTLEGTFLGRTKLRIRRTDNATETRFWTNDYDITVLRVTGWLDLAFTYSVATLVAIIYINMGAAVDTRIMTQTLKKPIGPAIGFFSQFVIMPLVSHRISSNEFSTKVSF